MRSRQMEERVRELEIANAKLEAQLESQSQTSVKMIDLYKGLLAAENLRFDNLLDAHRSLLEARAEPPVQTEYPSFIGNLPLYVNETEEDAQFQLENGLIDQDMYNQILEEVGLVPNAQVFNEP